MLESGIDTNVNLGNGVFGFQGDYSALTVTDDVAQTGLAGTRDRRRDPRDRRRHRPRSGRDLRRKREDPKRCTIDGAGSGGSGAANPATHTIVQAASALLARDLDRGDAV